MNDTNDVDGGKKRENIMTYVITLMQTPIITISKKQRKNPIHKNFSKCFTYRIAYFWTIRSNFCCCCNKSSIVFEHIDRYHLNTVRRPIVSNECEHPQTGATAHMSPISYLGKKVTAEFLIYKRRVACFSYMTKPTTIRINSCRINKTFYFCPIPCVDSIIFDISNNE